MAIWNKLDEVIGSGILGAIAFYSLHMGIDSGVSQMCITGIVALLAVRVAKGKGETNVT